MNTTAKPIQSIEGRDPFLLLTYKIDEKIRSEGMKGVLVLIRDSLDQDHQYDNIAGFLEDRM
jgi:hypothetical protein